MAGTMSLAGIRYESAGHADPAITRNIHKIGVHGGFGVLNVRVENLPSHENPKTSYIVVLFAITTTKKLIEAVWGGT